MNKDISPFMLPAPTFEAVKEQLNQEFPELDLSPQADGGQRSRLAIINTANRPWAVVESSFLIEHLASFEIGEFYYSQAGRAFQSDTSDRDESVVCVQRLSDLLETVSEFKPSTIYLRISPHTKSEYLVSVFRTKFPCVALIVEPYDLSCLFEPEILGYRDSRDCDYAQAMLGCAVALHLCDAVVAKMGGNRFEHYEKPFPEKFIPFFPTSSYSVGSKSVSDKCNKKANSLRQILYAGSASARELNGGVGSVDGANLAKYFDAIVNSEEFELVIVNGAHSSPEEDNSPKFKMLLQRYAFPEEKNKKCTYFRAITQRQLAELAINFDLGICCAHYAEDRVMDVTQISLPNRMTSYIQAGLPVIIDDRFEYAGSLIEEFGAGAMIPAGDFDSFTHTLANIDINKAKTGVVHLKRFFQEENNKNLAFLLLAFR